MRKILSMLILLTMILNVPFAIENHAYAEEATSEKQPVNISIHLESHNSERNDGLCFYVKTPKVSDFDEDDGYDDEDDDDYDDDEDDDDYDDDEDDDDYDDDEDDDDYDDDDYDGDEDDDEDDDDYPDEGVTVPVDTILFPDPKFREYILDQIDEDGDGSLSYSELRWADTIDCSGMEIFDLTGIEHFSMLTLLKCGDNHLSKLDVSKNRRLEELSCYNNNLTNLDLNGNKQLYDLDCSDNQLTGLDVKMNDELEFLVCSGNQLSSLKVGEELVILDCSANRLESLDLSKSDDLYWLDCTGNKIQVLSVSECEDLVDAVNEYSCVYRDGYRFWGDENGEAYFAVDNITKILTGTAVISPVPSAVRLSRTSVEMRVGDTVKLAVKFSPQNAESSLSWGQTDKSIAMVDENGVVTAKGIGNATVSVVTENGLHGECEIKVKETVSWQDTTGTYSVTNKGAVFKKTAAAATVKIPDTIKFLGKQVKVISIADNAFSKNKKLTAISIGKNVKTIGKKAFASCEKLKKITGGAGVVTIKEGAFTNCKGLKAFPALGKLQTIGANAFSGCIKLMKFTLGKAVKSIGKSAFNGCKALKSMDVKTTKLTDKTIGDGCFKGISKTAQFTCPSKMLEAYKTLFVNKGAPKTCKFK